MAKKSKSFLRSHPKIVGALVLILILIIAAAVVLYVLKPELFQGLIPPGSEITNPDDGSGDGEGTTPSDGDHDIAAGSVAEISTAEFSIHFLELGNKYTGDCTLIDCGDTEVLIDAGSRNNSAPTINSYIEQYCDDGKLEYVIATHAHQDHIAGFVGNASGDSRTGVLYSFEVGTIIQFSGHNTNSNIYNNYVAATEYCTETYGTAVYEADDCWYERNGAPKSISLNDSGTLTLNILYNYYYENTTSDENDYSVCTLLTYAPEGEEETHYLFTGDLEADGEERLVQNNELPKVELYKGGHHGSKTSSSEELLSVIQPKYVAVCCCAGSDEYTDNNDNMFPTQDFINRISAYTDKVYVTTMVDGGEEGYTSMNGDIVFYLSQNELKLWCSNNSTLLKDTDWFKLNRVCENWGWTSSDREQFASSQP